MKKFKVDEMVVKNPCPYCTCVEVWVINETKVCKYCCMIRG